MTAVHRPLSAWVSRLQDETLGPVNDCDDRADARAIESFSAGWDRAAVRWRNRTVLGLIDKAGMMVVELDDYGRPIPITDLAFELIRAIERRWPAVELGEKFQSLAGAALPLRYWLLERLAAEGDPPDEAFFILPWELLDRAVRSVLTTLATPDRAGELVEIRHWLTPAVRGLTAPLEQLDHGLRTGDGTIARLGAEGLLDRLRTIPLGRIPDESVAGLVPLVTRLGEIDPLYRHTSRIVRGRLTGGERSVPQMRITLSSSLDAAANHEEVREHTESVEDDTFHVRVDETQAGWVRVFVEAANPSTDGPFDHHTGVFARVLVVPRDTQVEQRYWVALYPEGDGMVGALTFALPRGWSEIDCDSMPVGVDELASVTPEELLPSLHAGIPPSTRQWLDLIDALPPNHPARIAAERFEEAR
jgi:hypothetical protein